MVENLEDLDGGTEISVTSYIFEDALAIMICYQEILQATDVS